MDRLAEQVFVIAIILAGVCALGVLHCAASAVRNHHEVHDLRARVNHLRTMQLRKKERGEK